jgi:hypothetical protein
MKLAKALLSSTRPGARGSEIYKIARNKLRISGRFVPASKIEIEHGIPDPNALVIVRMVVHQVQGVLAGRDNVFVEAMGNGKILCRTSIRVNARDPL